MKRLLPILLVIPLLAGCASPTTAPEMPAPTLDGAAYTKSIQTLWGDCLASLNVTDALTYTPNGAGKAPLGYVKVSDLSWSISLSNTGEVLNVPTDSITTAKLATVGC